ncbi:MAG TPA: hypothetical protein VNG90_01085 [Candidatus Acidoferrum sp.]|nr:hypothetical protein [Candidatus Acidoferrum sp.]
MEKEFKLFVGGIPYPTTQEELTAHFEQAGFKLGEEVLSVEVIADKYTGRPKGFAFVKMRDEESMQQAIEKLNGTVVGGDNGRSISVNEARPREDRGDRGGSRGGNGGGYQGGGNRGGYSNGPRHNGGGGYSNGGGNRGGYNSYDNNGGYGQAA